jgi:hypothetical protein
MEADRRRQAAPRGRAAADRGGLKAGERNVAEAMPGYWGGVLAAPSAS